jgi:hypothetical protein
MYTTGKGNHISSVKSYSTRTATSSLLAHLQWQHNIANGMNEIDTHNKSTQTKLHIIPSQLLTYFKSVVNMKPSSAKPNCSDLTLFFALDLRHFTCVENDGFKYFFRKNLNLFN